MLELTRDNDANTFSPDALIIQEVEGYQRTFSVVSEDILTLGRNPDCNVVLRDGSAAGHHCQITSKAHIWMIVDLSTQSGTFVNGIRVQKQLLYTGDVIQIATHSFRVSIPSDDSRNPALVDTALSTLKNSSRSNRNYLIVGCVLLLLLFAPLMVKKLSSDKSDAVTNQSVPSAPISSQVDVTSAPSQDVSGNGVLSKPDSLAPVLNKAKIEPIAPVAEKAKTHLDTIAVKPPRPPKGLFESESIIPTISNENSKDLPLKKDPHRNARAENDGTHLTPDKENALVKASHTSPLVNEPHALPHAEPAINFGGIPPKLGVVTWTGAINNSWEEAGNWSGNNVPTNDDDVKIENATIVLHGGKKIMNAAISGHVTFNEGEAGGYLYVDGTFVINAEAEFTLNTSNIDTTGSLKIGEKVTGVAMVNNGILNIVGGGIAIYDSIHQNDNPLSMVNNGTITISNGKGSCLFMNGYLLNSGVINATAGQIDARKGVVTTSKVKDRNFRYPSARSN